ncbi:MAG: hypothetical protein J6N81_02940 [Treponema sp.]|nr:hypothetical protein [Treponema sp.]
MAVVFIAAFFCVLNISLWITIILKFKKLFSTDDIIASTREEMDNMIADMNRNAGRNIELIEDRIKQLKLVVAEADRHIETAKREIESQKNALSYQQKIDSVVNAKKSSQPGFSTSERAAQKYLQTQNISAGLQSGNRYEITDEGNRHVKHGRDVQGDLFEQAEADDNKRIVSDTGTTFTVESDGSSYASVPVIGGNVSYADDPIHPQKKFGELVRDLHYAGHSVEEIARELNSSTTEVQLVIDMDLGF